MAAQPVATPSFRTFLIIWITQSISVFGSMLNTFATNVWMAQVLYPNPDQRPQLAAAFAMINLAYALPMALIAPIAGTFADRHSRKRIMMTADGINSALSIALAILVFTGQLGLVSLLIINACSAICNTFHYSAFSASYSMIVPKEDLPRANGMMQTMWYSSSLLSPLAGALIIALPARAGLLSGTAGGVTASIILDAATFILGALALAPLIIPSPSDAPTSPQAKTTFWQDTREGARFLSRRRSLLWLLGMFTLTNFVFGLNEVMSMLILRYNLVGDWTARGWSYETALAGLNTLSALGGLAGGVLITASGGLKNRKIYGVLIPMLVMGFAQIAFGLSTSVVAAGLMVFVFAATIPIMSAHSTSIWQTATPNALQGRVFSLRAIIGQATRPFSNTFAGIAGGFLNPGYTAATIAIVFVLVISLQFFNRPLLECESEDQAARPSEREQQLLA